MVRDNNIEQALRVLKQRMQREGVFREIRLREHFEKPAAKRAREKPRASAALGKSFAKAGS
jgi:small subunit ribosomal protein S21